MKIIGHRGARGLAPENTVKGFQKALKHHVDMVELDLRVCRDGVVIAHHDPYLIDPNGNKHIIEDHSYSKLLEHKADLATFEQALAIINRAVPIYVEIKPHEPTKPIIKIIQDHLSKGWQPDDFRIASFDQTILMDIREKLPAITVTILEKWSGVRASRRARQLGTVHLLMNQRWLWWGFIRQMTRHGYKLGAYTVNNPKQAAKWQKHGLAAVVTDYPDMFEK
ncbi:MAG: glycerophosphodiester phosphodiesterase [Patescibacteria group bacterium]